MCMSCILDLQLVHFVVKSSSVAMLAISKYIKNVSVVRNLVFAVMNFSKDLPSLWGVAVEFATWGQETRQNLNAEQAKLLVQNMQELDLLDFDSDKELLQDLMEFQAVFFSGPLGGGGDFSP